jgi:uncharacterized protein YbjT (DUF2867 family)
MLGNMTALLAGATGLVGRALAENWTGSEPLHLLVRRPLPAGWPLQPAHRVHMVDFAALPPLPRADAAFCALGTTIRAAGSREAFRAVDLEAVLAFARAAGAAGVRRFGLVSSLGADPASRNFYACVKGQAEQELCRLGFARLVIARPSLLLGDRHALGQPARPAEALGQHLGGWLGPVLPRAWRPVPAAHVARALRRALAADGPAVELLESARLHTLGAPA